ncbi:hypothetical protein ACFE04_013982 [Oxalis oulophora]
MSNNNIYNQVNNNNNNNNTSNDDQFYVINIYPLNFYYFGSSPQQPLPFKDHETVSDRLQRFKNNYEAYGLRTRVEAVILVELYKHPHLLLLQERNAIFKLPGGRTRPGESDIDGLKRELSRKISDKDGIETDWQVGDCMGMWWRPDFESILYPYLPPNIKKPKECTKLFLVRLPEYRKFIVPKNMSLLAVPLCQVHENKKTYGQIISGVPQLLSKYSFNVIDTRE